MAGEGDLVIGGDLYVVSLTMLNLVYRSLKVLSVKFCCHMYLAFLFCCSSSKVAMVKSLCRLSLRLV